MHAWCSGRRDGAELNILHAKDMLPPTSPLACKDGCLFRVAECHHHHYPAVRAFLPLWGREGGVMPNMDP